MADGDSAVDRTARGLFKCVSPLDPMKPYAMEAFFSAVRSDDTLLVIDETSAVPTDLSIANALAPASSRIFFLQNTLNF